MDESTLFSINDFKYAEWLDRAGIAAVSSVRTTTTADAFAEAADAMRASLAGAPGSAESGLSNGMGRPSSKRSGFSHASRQVASARR